MAVLKITISGHHIVAELQGETMPQELLMKVPHKLDYVTITRYKAYGYTVLLSNQIVLECYVAAEARGYLLTEHESYILQRKIRELLIPVADMYHSTHGKLLAPESREIPVPLVSK